MKTQIRKIGVGLLLAVMFLTAFMFSGQMNPTAKAATSDWDYSVNEDNLTATITKYSGVGGDVTIPSQLGGYKITCIGEDAFISCDSITSVVIPSSVTRIMDWAFLSCSNLTSITIPSSVASIGKGAFGYCESLVTINVNSGNQYFASQNGVLYSKDMKELLLCPNGKSAGYSIPSSVTIIGDYAFSVCSGLTSFTIPSGVVSIGLSAFRECCNLTSVIIPSTVKRIGNGAFYDSCSLTSITIPSGVETIGSFAFSNTYCQSDLVSVAIPASVKSIGYGAFSRCSSLTSITVNSGNQYYTTQDNVLYTKDMKTVVVFPGGKSGSFSIPSSVSNIEREAFCGCNNLKTVTIPSGVTNIGQNAFLNCGNLTMRVYPDSQALQYAINNDISYSLILPAPKVSSIYKVSGGVKLQWKSVAGATKYRVLRKTTGSYEKIAETTLLNYTDTTAKNGTKYTYSVRAINSDGVAGSYAAGKTITPLAAPKLSSVYKVSNGVKFIWKAVDGASKYRVYRKTGTGSYSRIAETTALEYVDTTAVNGTKYTYTVRALDENGNLASWYYTGGKAITPLAAVQVSSVYKVSGGVRVNIKAVSGAVKYRVYRKTTGSYEQIGVTETTEYTDTTAANGTRYTYAVRAEDTNGALASWYGTGKAITPLPAPQLGTISNTSTGVKFTWKAVSGAAKYRVMRKTGSGSYTNIAETTDLSYIDTTAVKGTKYTYTVRAIDEGGVAASWYYTSGKTITKS